MDSSSSPSPPAASSRTSLNYLNYLNIIGYAINLFTTFAGQSIFKLTNIGELSNRYQTIVTPAGYVFIIWGVIFVTQAVFAFAQVSTNSSESSPLARDLVQKGVKYWYFIACIAQAGWVLAFGYEKILLSTIFMAVILVSLLLIVILQSNLPTMPNLWIFDFPFSIHCGWIFVAFAANVNLFLVSRGYDGRVQTISAILTLVYVLIVAAFSLFVLKRPNYTIPLVLAWASFGIAAELSSPAKLILDTFPNQTIRIVRTATLGIGFLLVAVVGGYAYYNNNVVGKRKEEETDEEGGTVG